MFEIERIVARLRMYGSDTHDVEAKSAAGGVPSTLAETMSAFANTPGGGHLILGLDERRNFSSVPIDAPKLKQAVSSVARTSLSPPIAIQIEDVDFEGNHLVVVRVPELALHDKPCYVTREGKAYLRCWDGDFELSQVEIQGLLVNRTQPRSDGIAVNGATRADLSNDLVADFIATARASDQGLARITADDSLLRKTGVLTAGNIPTAAGLLALGEYPQEWFPNFVIQAATSPEDGAPAGTRFGDVMRFSGPLPQMIDDALTWVQRHSRHRIVDGADGRVRDVYDFPPIAVRELLSNALVHRDLGEWALSKAVELRISDTELRLTNPGGLYGVTLARLLETEVTSARNLLLTRVCQFVRLRDGRVVEALASGIPRIVAATTGAGLPDPTFFDQGITFTAKLHRPKALGNHDVPATPTLPTQRLTGAQKRVYDALGSNQISQAALATRLGLSEQATLKHLRVLRSVGLVERTGGQGVTTTTYRQAIR